MKFGGLKGQSLSGLKRWRGGGVRGHVVVELAVISPGRECISAARL